MDIPASQKPRPGDLCLDHIGHFVPDLEAANDLLVKLGFRATPISVHQANGKPAGTSNRCVMLEQGYLEILAPTLDTPNAGRVRARMKRYDGVHLVCYGTPAPEEEHARLAARGFAPEPLVSLARKVNDGKDEVRFKVVYVAPEKMAECRAQYCEHMTPDLMWNAKDIAHDNGATGLTAAYLVADDVPAVSARWAEFSGLLPREENGLVRLATARGDVFIGDRRGLSAFIDNVPPAPGVAAIGLRFKDPKEFAVLCEKASLKIKRSERGYCVSLPPALGGSWVF